MLDCTDQVRNYVEWQEIERAISLNVENIVDGTMAEAPECMEEALMIVDDMIDHACLNGSARDESDFTENDSLLEDDNLFD